MKLYKKHISDLGKVITGKTPRTSILENYGGKIPFLTPSDNLSEKFSLTTSKTLTKIGLNEVKNCLLPSKSICVSCIGSDLGKVVLTKKPTVTNQQFNSIVPNEENDADFIYYLMTVVGKHLNYLSKTSTAVPIINKSTFANYEIEIPNIKEQKRIGKILSSLDDKIELNRRINDNLERQAQALFKSWFVDFEPFKDGKFVDSELGMIPEGWRVGNLLDIAKLYDAKRKPLSSRERENMKKIYPYYGATSIMDYVDKYIFDGTYLLMGEDGSVMDDKGYPYLQYVFGKFWSNNHAHVMQGKNNFSTEMLHCLLLKKNISPIVTGAVQAKISQANMRKILITQPPHEITIIFSSLIKPIYEIRKKNELENQRLSILRDTLLPKLMFGELKINDINN